MTKLICADCRHENEAERIYCHNCGGRLDRSALKKTKSEKVDSESQSQQHLQKMLDPRRGRTKALVMKCLTIVGGAFLLAVVIQALLPPDLPPVVKNDSFAPMISMDLLSALESHNPPHLTYSQEQVNSYVASAIRRANSPAKEGFFPLRRIYLQLEEGLCGVNASYTFMGLPLHTGGAYEVAIKDGKVLSTCRRGYCGRMPIHPALMNSLGFLLSKVSATFDREEKQLSRCNGVEFHPELVTLFTAPRG